MLLFDALIKPIILYGSEIWGTGNNCITETFHNRFCKSMLGLSRNATNSTTLGDLGRFPMQIFIDIAILKVCPLLHYILNKGDFL
jgi:hypothetical protein